MEERVNVQSYIFPKQQKSESSKLKASTNKKINAAQIIRLVSERADNMVGKGENNDA